MKTWLWSQAVLKTLSIGQAAAYTVGNWDRLTRFLGDARIPLDNNATERGIRGPVVGRKNHYGSKSRRGTEVAATFYTLIETAKLHGVNPAEYLLAAVRAADRGDVLMPWELVQPDAPTVKTGYRETLHCNVINKQENPTLRVTQMSDKRNGRPKHRGDKLCPTAHRPC
jgi:hypothetical protein